MATLYVGDREIHVSFETPSKANLSVLANNYRTFGCTVEHTKGNVTAENLVDAATGLVKDVVAYEATYEDVQAERAGIVHDANLLLGMVDEEPGSCVALYDDYAPRRKFLGIF